MNLKTEPYIIELAEAAWVAKALSTDSKRAVLTMAALAYYEGAAVLVATDTYRLHILRLGPTEKEFPTRLVDLRRIIFEARYAKATHIWIDAEGEEVTVGKITRSDKFRSSTRIYAPIFDTIAGTYPDFARVIPKTSRQASELFAINSKFLSDALELSRNHAFRTVILSEGPNKAVVFQVPEDNPRWRAVVSPMRLDEWDKGKVSK